MFTSHTLLFLLGVTDGFSDDAVRLVIAAWFFSVSYLLAKRVNRSRRLADVAGHEQMLQADPSPASHS